MSPFILLLAAGVALLLFWLMSEELLGQRNADGGAGEGEQSERPLTPHSALRTPHSLPRRLFFSLLGGAVVLLLAGGRQPEAQKPVRPQGDPARAFSSYVQGLLNAKLSFALPAPPKLMRSESPEKLRAQAIREYEAAIRQSPNSPTFRRQLGILYGFQGNRVAALRQLHRVVQIERERGDPNAGVEARLWDQVCGEPPAPASAIPQLRKQLDALRLGWFEHLALAALYRRAGDPKQAEAAVQSAAREALLHLGVLGAVEFALLALAVCGLVGGIVFVVRAARGELRPVPVSFHVGPALLWEAFILFMFLYALPSLLRIVSPGLGRSAAITQSSTRALALTILLLIAADGLALLAVLYLRVQLARRGLSLAEVGLHARDLSANIVAGVVSYMMAIPWVIASAVLAQWLGQRFLRDVAPPFHPFEALTAGAHEWWLRFLLYAIAALGAPFFEELFFRGALYGAIRRRFGVATGVIASAALFAGLHPQFPIGFPPLFVLGAILAGVYEWRQSLVPGMVLHGIQNSIAFLLLNLLFPPGG